MGSKTTSVQDVGQTQRHDRAEKASALLQSDSYARGMSDAPSIYTAVTAESLDAHDPEWLSGYAAVVSYICRHGGMPATSARSHGFAVGAWLDAQHTAQLSTIQRAALMAIPGITLSRSPKLTIRTRSVERNAAWIRIQSWAHARCIEQR